MLDAPSEVVEIALNYLGYDANTENTKANEEALELLKQIRPYINILTHLNILTIWQMEKFV